MTNAITAFMKAPNAYLGVREVLRGAMGSWAVSQLVNVATTAAKAVPMITATARSIRLPRSRKFLKPFMPVHERGREA